MSNSVQLHPWDSPGKNTGVGWHFLLQCIKVKSESEVAQSCLTCHDPMDCSLPGSSVHGIFQARVLEWGSIAFSECGSAGDSLSQYIHMHKTPYFIFIKVYFWGIEFKLDICFSVLSRYYSTIFLLAFFFQKEIFCLLYFCSSVGNVCVCVFSLLDLRVLFIIECYKFYYNLFWCNFIPVFCIWSFLSFLGLWDHNFYQILKF